MTRPVVPRSMFLAGCFIAFAALLILTSRIAGGDGATPPPPGDTQDYDNIAVQLLHGRGFAMDFTDPEWRRPYQEHNPEGDFDAIVGRAEPLHLTTYRPPLLPLALAVTYRIFGRNFLAWRIIEAVLVAMALALVCDVAWSAFGSGVALVSAAFMFLSGTYVHYVAYWALLTEPLAIFFAALFIWSLASVTPANERWMVALSGVGFALLCLTRTFYVLWLPFAVAFIWWMVRRTGGRRAMRSAALFAIVAVGLQLPWWIRNCRVTGSFMPLGTMSGVTMYAAYSDFAYAHRGAWAPALKPAYENAYVRELGLACTGCTEVELARYGSRGGRAWILGHLTALPKLAYWKLANTWMSMSETGLIAPAFWLVAFAPIILWRRRDRIRGPVAAAVAGSIVLNFGVIALTWFVGWRFVVVIEPLLTILIALPIASAVFGEETIAAELSPRSR